VGWCFAGCHDWESGEERLLRLLGRWRWEVYVEKVAAMLTWPVSLCCEKVEKGRVGYDTPSYKSDVDVHQGGCRTQSARAIDRLISKIRIGLSM